METKEMKIGDVVVLKSSVECPKMTVRKINNNDITCDWFDNATIMNHTFNILELKIITE